MSSLLGACYTERISSSQLKLSINIVDDLATVDQAAWDALDHGPSPFLEYGFLRALELSGSLGKDSGWLPFYVLAQSEGGRLEGAVAAFVKLHSYGEYIFDFQWAKASERAGIPYYPKLVVAAPVTPATGNRILLREDTDEEAVTHGLVHGVKQLADELGASSIHWLFCTAREQDTLARLGFAPRASYQFHWHNHGYADFDAFLARMSSRKRKQFRKERRRCGEDVDALEWIEGEDLTAVDIETMDGFYRRNVSAHWGEAYLRPGFFRHLQRLAPRRLKLFRAVRGGEAIAGAIYLETERGLYGRYWGCDERVEFLHFEASCYAGIQRCIDRGIPLFEAGAQGEHKLLRGFAPSPTYSAHWLRHPDLDRAIREFLREEAMAIEMRMRRLSEYLPYKRGADDGPTVK